MKKQAWIAAAGAVALLVASCGSPEATNPLQKYAGNPDYVIGKSAVRCIYFFDMVRAGTKYSYENHQFLAPQMITDEYLMIMQSTYEREYRNQLESHRKGMNDKTYSNLFKSISNFYFQKIGASKPDINLYLENVGPSENSDMIRIITAFGRGNLNFEEYKDLYKEINQIGENIDCALLQDGTYKEFLRKATSTSGEVANDVDIDSASERTAEPGITATSSMADGRETQMPRRQGFPAEETEATAPSPSPNRNSAIASQARGPEPIGQSRWASRIIGSYPSRALRDQIEGVVTVSLSVGESGRVVSCEVSSSSGSAILDQAACEGMQRLARFKPALDRSGNSIVSSWSTRVVFKLN
ncbi:TonB family protein [Sphingorhabdus sp. EL138]|uniref:TonB family protein n=1 Tax=Sphingorhabdus sp. EL138 TaxID=2073156 RepID=UPI0025EDAE09|nr:TonB family protein [Sphingorhabdus sp. EL138]